MTKALTYVSGNLFESGGEYYFYILAAWLEPLQPDQQYYCHITGDIVDEVVACE